jgi:hypothetical protein
MAKKNFVGAKGARLLRRVAKHILAEPKRLDMAYFIDRVTDPKGVAHKMPPCGTVGCIAGWAVTLSTTERVAYGRIATRAAKFIGIGDVVAQRLFYPGQWPEEFSRINEYRAQTVRHARLTAKRIEHFIKTGE